MKTESGHCGICGSDHSPVNCDVVELRSHIIDKPVPSKARLTLPDELEINVLADCMHTIIAQCVIEKGTRFGPFEAKKLCSLLPSIHLPLKIFSSNAEDLSEYYLDTSNEHECSWMMFVAAATDFEEQNLICYQDADELFYVTIRDIEKGEQLKVWYSPYYALKMNKKTLKPIVQEEDLKDVELIDQLVEHNKNVAPRKLWNCKFCGKLETKLCQFATHLLEHYRAKLRRVCELCKDSFLTKQALMKHIKVVHNQRDLEKNGEHISASKIISKQIPRQKLKDTSVGGPLLLNKMDEDSMDNSSFNLASTDLHNFELSSIENQNNLFGNLNLNMDGILNENVKELDDFNFDLKETDTEQLVCDICLKGFKTLKFLVLHLDQHTGKHICYDCNKVFARKESLLNHPCKTFYKLKCAFCDRLFFQKKYLNRHMKLGHMKNFNCNVCKNSFDSYQKFTSHGCKRKPARTKQFTCSICPKQYNMRSNLLAHERGHDQKVTYTCPICGVKLQSKKSYLKHNTKHYGDAHTCGDCGKVFYRADSLKVHQKDVHLQNMVSCDICMKQISSKKLLKRHMAIHENVNKHACSICNRTFTVKQNLIRHVNSVHNGDDKKQFTTDTLHSCPKCDVKVKFRQSLGKHIRKHHPDHEFTRTARRTKPAKGTSGREEDDAVLDLKRTIENMNFSTDEINYSENTDINLEIDKILSTAGNIDSFFGDSNERLVENLLNIAVKDSTLTGLTADQYVPKEPCLSMPELTDND